MTTTDKIVQGWQESIQEIQKAIEWAEANRANLDQIKQECYVSAGAGYPWVSMHPDDPKDAARKIGGNWVDHGGQWVMKHPSHMRIQIQVAKPERAAEKLVQLEKENL
jgi:hypothetical protein